jgi:hypothetical protein
MRPTARSATYGCDRSLCVFRFTALRSAELIVARPTVCFSKHTAGLATRTLD